MARKKKGDRPVAVTTWGQARTYNVLCASEMNTDKPVNRFKKCKWHDPDVHGVAEVLPSETEIDGVKFDTTVVRFLGYTWKLLDISSGLNGIGVALFVERPLHFHDMWKLYTDTPTDESTSVEEVRRQAEWAIAHRPAYY